MGEVVIQSDKTGNKGISIAEDGKIHKFVLREGSGAPPPLHASCIVQYVGRLQQSKEIFMNTHAEGTPARVVAGRKAVLNGAGLNLAVATMLVGERAIVSVNSQYGYGSKGHFSFPAIPPDADLEYEVELLGYDVAREGGEPGSMLFEERVEAAERRKLEGNSLFKDGKLLDAVAQYTMGLSYMDQDFMFQLEGKHEEMAQRVRSAIYLNLAACQLQNEDFHGAVGSCNQVLAMGRRDTKALFRRGKARRALGQYDLALEDLKSAQQEAPRDSAISKELRAVMHSQQEQLRGADNLFRGQFKAEKKPQLQTSIWQYLWLQILAVLAFLGLKSKQQ